MKTYIFLLLFGFIQLVFCDCKSGLNITDYDSYPVCLVDLFRRKRSNAEYTRWRANQDLTTNEFLVKVLDEDLTTPQKQKIVAVNIQPLTAGGEKIIIGGAKVLPPTSPIALSTTDVLKDYTRFAVPPTTAKTRAGELYLAPVQPPQVTYPPILPPGKPKGASVNRNAQRDDSPPASPQFLARTPTLTGRQYAPIAPVAFTRRHGFGPVTPPTTHTTEAKFDTSEFIPTPKSPFPGIPTRTTSYLDSPARTGTTSYPDDEIRTTDSVDEFQTINSFDEGSSPISFRGAITSTTYSIPERTSTLGEINVMSDIEADLEAAAREELEQKSFVGDGRRREEVLKKAAEKDSESSYNMMFYNDEDASNSNPKKEDLDISDINIEVSTEHVSSDNREQEIDDLESKEPEYSSENSTSQLSPVGVIGIPDGEINKLKERKDTYRDKRRPFCSLYKLRPLNFNSPRTLPEITNQLKQWAEASPLVKWIDITEGNFTTMENPIYMMIIDDPSSGQILSAKQTVMIVAGMQGRDHHAVTAAMYVLYQLIERSEAHTDLLSKYRFWIIPVFNPDGYDYSMTFPQRREWTKNLRQLWETCKDREACKPCEEHGLRCLVQPCYGVHLDRNFEYQWIPAEELRSDNPCGNLYSGVRQLSELETFAITQFLDKQRTPLYTFIAFKEGNTLGVMYPYSHTKNKRAYDHVYRKRAAGAAAAAYSISNRPYVSGQTSEFLPLYAGGIEDWMDGHLGIDNTYTIVLFRPSDSYKTHLITERVVHEAYAAMDTLLLQSTDNDPVAPVAMKRRRSNTAPIISPTHSLTILPMVALLYG